MMRLFKNENSRKWMTVIVTTLLAIMAAYFSAIAIRKTFIYSEQERFMLSASSTENQFITEFIQNKILGVVSSSGLVNPVLQKALLTPDPENLESALQALNALQTHYKASIVYLMNQKGDVIESTTYEKNKSLKGNNYKFRPYFIEAKSGKSVLYAALGVTTQRRGLYYSAPVYDSLGLDEHSSIAGVLVIKMNISGVDKFLEKLEGPAFLLSPDGIVFATNRDKKWLFKSIAWLDAERIKKIQESKQFSNRFHGKSEILEMRAKGKLVTFKEKDYFVLNHVLPINDTAGNWRLVVMGPLDLSRCWLVIGTCVFLIITAYTAGILALNSFHRERRMKRAVIEKEVASKVKSQFLANMSHEIRTPMNSIIGFTSLLLDSDLNEYQLKAMNLIQQSCDSLLSLINDILDLSKIEADKMELEESPFDIYELISHLCHLCVTKFDTEKVDFYCDIAPCDSYQVVGDSKRFNQVILNILDNAIKFTREGRIEFRLVKLAETRESLRFQIIINDTGIGIEKSKLNHIFSPFSQAEAETSRKFGGTGLGLALVKSLVDLMKGKIKIDSSLNSGTTFTLEFEFAKNESDKNTGKTQGISLLSDRRILLWDENQDSLKLHLKILEYLGMEADGVVDIDEFFKHYQNFQYDFILFDWKVISKRNISSISKFLPNIDEPDSPILFAMAYNSLETIGESNSHVRFIQRPLFARMLWDVFNNALLQKGETEISPDEEQVEEPTEEVLETQSKVLVIDDDPRNNILVEAMFERMNHRNFHLAKSGATGLTEATTGEYELILMDIQLPDMDGMEVTKKMRKNGVTAPIIAFTAHAMPEMKDACLKTGMNDFMVKPISFKTFESVVTKWI